MTTAHDTQGKPAASVEAPTLTLRYFAWVREKVGHAEENVSLPDGITTISSLVEWLRSRGENYEAAFARPEVIRAAIDQTHARPETPIGDAREVAFFPPVTGG